MTPRHPHAHRRVTAYTAVVVTLLALVACLGLTSAASASAAPYCGLVWGSLGKSGGAGTAGALVGVRTGRHDCYDRLVLDLRAGASAAYSVQYVDSVFRDPRGDVVTVNGGARLRIVVHAPSGALANAADLADVRGYQTFRQVAGAGSFEGQSTLGLGVRARLPFRAFLLAGPGDGSRLVVDVAHFW